jgi:dynein intermediate chain 2
MDIQYVYTKKRNEFGRPTNFTDRSAEILTEIVPNLNLLKEFIYRNPVEIGVQNSIQLSEHEVNTLRYNTETKGINHTEGGWPKDVNIQEQDQINRFRKKIEKDEIYLNSLSRLIHVKFIIRNSFLNDLFFKDLEVDIQQNNAINIHQNYFQNKIDDYDEPFNIKTINLYNYNSNKNQMVNHISWQPDGQRKLVVSYSTIDSLIWDIGINNLKNFFDFHFYQ